MATTLIITIVILIIFLIIISRSFSNDLYECFEELGKIKKEKEDNIEVYIEDEEISLDMNKEEIRILQEITQEVIYNECDCRRAFHKLLKMTQDNH